MGSILALASPAVSNVGGIALVPLVLATLAADARAEGPTFLCGRARVQRDGSAPAVLPVVDRFASRELTVARPDTACWATSPGTGLLEGYGVPARPRKVRRVRGTIDVVTRFGRESLVVKALDELRVPSSDSAEAMPASLACYGVRRTRGGATRSRVVVSDATAGEQTFDVGRALRICVPPTGESMPELVCHAVRLARTKPLGQRAAPSRSLTLATRLGTDVLRVGRARELCVPALASPDPDPEPAFALAVTPSAIEVIAGTRPALEAVARFPDGHTEIVTGRVLWSSSDESVVSTGSPAGAFPISVGPGTAVVRATDVATGISSADTGGDATVTVTWPLEKLVLTPHATTRRPGEHLGYTVTGWFAGGTTRNVTQRMVYASSDPTVALATNLPGNRSRVLAVAPGTAIISATDPLSGISTTDSGNDATMRVAGALAYVVVTSNLRYSSRFPGQSQRFTATGYFYGGASKNLTQSCAWSSSDPSVAVATNPEGDRSRIDAVAPGSTIISCTDPATGLSGLTRFYVMGALERIAVHGYLSPHEWLRNGDGASLTAIGTYEGGGQRNLTQEVTWTSRDPAIAVATNDPQNKSRVVGVSGGVARVFATDEASGIASDDALVSVLGNLLSLEIFGTWNPTVLPLDYTRPFPVRGIFEYGTLNLTYSQRGYRLESSDPAVLEIVDDVRVRGVAPGIVDLIARDLATDATSPPVPIRVKGGLDHITLTPASATRGIGEWESFTAIGHYPPDLTELLTQRLVWTSSDPSVVVADNTPGQRSRVRTVGAGTATITATDVTTGVTGTATITVLPGTIERITVEPATVVRNVGNDFSFTAIGHYPGGATINVTQIVTWQSLDPQVAETPNGAGDRSRVVPVAQGQAVIVATHPSGVSSHATGDDATLVAKTLTGLTLAPVDWQGQVGWVQRFTLVGTFADATTINLTQDAFYWVDDGAVARADNVDGDRSAIELLAPGVTTLHAAFTDWIDGRPHVLGPVASTSLAVAP
jgi:uncharacterized protein YjdB